MPKVSPDALLSKSNSIGLSLREAAYTGFIADSLLKPTANQDDWILQRVRNGTIGATTFTVMAAGSLGLDQLAKAKTVQKLGAGGVLTNPIFSGIVSGLPAGLVAAELESLKAHNRFATRQELAQSIYSTAIVGGVLGPVNYYGGKASESLFRKRSVSGPVPESVVIESAGYGSKPVGRSEAALIEPASKAPAVVQHEQPVHPGASDNRGLPRETPGQAPGREFDAQNLHRARNHLKKHDQEGVPASTLDHYSAALVATFGKDWKTWLDQMENLGVERMDAAASLPLRPADKQAGLGQLLMENTTPARTSERNLDHHRNNVGCCRKEYTSG